MDKVTEYAFSAVLDTTCEEAIVRIKDALQDQGFGVLTEIDVKATLKKKLDQDFRKYVILGACAPPFAYRAIQADLDVGLLLPCNVIVYETDDSKAYVAAINPMSALQMIENEELRLVAQEVSGKLEAAVREAANI